MVDRTHLRIFKVDNINDIYRNRQKRDKESDEKNRHDK